MFSRGEKGTCSIFYSIPSFQLILSYITLNENTLAWVWCWYGFCLFVVHCQCVCEQFYSWCILDFLHEQVETAAGNLQKKAINQALQQPLQSNGWLILPQFKQPTICTSSHRWLKTNPWMLFFFSFLFLFITFWLFHLVSSAFCHRSCQDHRKVPLELVVGGQFLMTAC